MIEVLAGAALHEAVAALLDDALADTAAATKRDEYKLITDRLLQTLPTSVR